MRRSGYRRATASSGGNRRMLAVGAVITAIGAVVTFTTISNAATTEKPAGSDAGKVVNGQAILTDTCIDSTLPPHAGFQDGNRCVSTEFGEVGVAANNPSLLITSAPDSVAVATPFTLKVSTRNLIRDRFLAAGAGGYYVESSVLNNGLERGHFHTACRMLSSTKEAPDPSPVPAFFVATEDSKGGATPDVVSIEVPGLPTAGTAQCASWAGDGSHRIPMMQRANQIPGLDAVRITVRDANGGGTGTGTGNGNTGGTGTGANTGSGTGANTGGGKNGNTGTGTSTGGGKTGNTGGGNTGTGTTSGNSSGSGNTSGTSGNGSGNTGGKGTTTAPTTAPTTTPAQAGKTTGPTTKDDITPNTKAPSKPAKTTDPAKASDNTSSNNTGSSNTGSSDTGSNTTGTSAAKPTEDSTTAPAPKATHTTTKPKPKAKASSAAGTEYTYSGEDGQVNSGTKAPVAGTVAEPPASGKSGGGLSLVANNTAAFVGGGAVMLLIGLVVMALTRRRRPGGSY